MKHAKWFAKSSLQLLHAYKQSARPDCEIDALTTAYKNAPTKTLKTQILNIYALKYSCDELKRIHAPFENLSDRQIKKAKKHARIVGAGMAIEKTPFHRVRIDLAKLSHFLSFVDQPFFLSRRCIRDKTSKARIWREIGYAERCANSGKINND